MAQVVDHVPSKLKALNLNCSIRKKGRTDGRKEGKKGRWGGREGRRKEGRK
jgi:hypothetical protein